jgi:hypothetical protein
MNKRRCALLLVTGGLSVAMPVQAQHSVSVTTEVERIENPLLSTVSPGGVTVLRVAPNYRYETQADRIQSRLSIGAVLERSSDTGLLASRTYPSLGYTWSYGWPTSSLELRANLAEAATRNTELQELGRVSVDSRERSLLAGARWTQELTARTDLTVDLSNTRVTYSPALLPDYRELEASGRITWEASERVFYYLEPAYARLTSSGLADATTQARWQAGVRNEIAPGWTLTGFAGQARVGSRPSSTGTLAGLQLAFAGSRWSSGAEWSRDVAVSASEAAYVRTESWAARFGYRLTEGASLSAQVTRSRSGGAGGSRGQVAGLVLENELGPQWSSVVGIEDRRSRPLGGTTASGWAVRAGLVYAYPGR